MHDGVPEPAGDEPPVHRQRGDEGKRERDCQARPEEDVGKPRIHRPGDGEHDGVVDDLHRRDRKSLGGERDATGADERHPSAKQWHEREPVAEHICEHDPEHDAHKVAKSEQRRPAEAEHLGFAKGKPNFPGVYWDIPELSYLPTSGRARVAPGVEVVPTPGHAPGHQSLVVDLAETGRVVLCGDAAFTRENLERGEIRAPDEPTAKESLALIRSLVKDDLDRVFTSHDAASWPRWKHAPDTYR